MNPAKIPPYLTAEQIRAYLKMPDSSCVVTHTICELDLDVQVEEPHEVKAYNAPSWETYVSLQGEAGRRVWVSFDTKPAFLNKLAKLLEAPRALSEAAAFGETHLVTFRPAVSGTCENYKYGLFFGFLRDDPAASYLQIICQANNLV